MSPKIIDKSKKSGEIARAALELFSRHGYSATSVKQIAVQAGMGKGTIYEYFSNKEAIFLEAVKEWMAGFNQLVFDKLEGLKDPIEKLYAIVEIKAEFMNPDNMATARMIIEILKHTLMKGGVIHERRDIMKEYYVRMQKAVVNILLEGISNGLFKPELAKDLGKISNNFLAFADAIGWHCNFIDEVNLKEQIDFYMKSMIEFLCIDARLTVDGENLGLAGT